MTFTLTLFLLSIFGFFALLAYTALCIEEKKFVSPFNIEVSSKLLVVATLSVGVLALVICLFNIYIRYFH